MKPVIKKLLINALKDLREQRENNGCNDLFEDEPLLKGISKPEQKELFALIKKEMPELVKELDAKKLTHLFDTNLVELLEKECVKL